jgi:hypothetical protein
MLSAIMLMEREIPGCRNLHILLHSFTILRCNSLFFSEI